MAKILKAEFNGSPMQFNDDGWFNATAAAERFNKDLSNWVRSVDAVSYIDALKSVENTDYVVTKKGRNGGTWLHPDLAVVFARWLDVRFAVWCDQQIKAIIYGTPEQTDWKWVRHEAAATYKVMSSMLDMKRQLEGKKAMPHHYANEAKLVNWALTGEFKSVDRDGLAENDLDLLAKLEEFNTLLIGQGFDRDTRKERLLLAVSNSRKGIE